MSEEMNEGVKQNNVIERNYDENLQGLHFTLLANFDNTGNGTVGLKNVNNCLNTNIYSYLDTFGGKSYSIYLNVQFFNTSVNQTSAAG